MTVLQGIDCSNHQGVVDFAAVAAAGVQFVLLKASGGAAFQDPLFANNVAAARAAGLAIGAYHFAFDDGDNPVLAEANNFSASVGGILQAGDVLALDVERAGGRPELGWVRSWLQLVEADFGCKPWLYTSPNGLAVYGLADASLADNGLWLADWGLATMPPAPAPWPVLAAWQYSSTGSVPGIAGVVDCDLFNGDLEQFHAYGLPQPVDPCADLQAQLVALAAQFATASAEEQRLRDILAQITQALEAI